MWLRQLVEQCKQPIDIVYTGLRTGEKLCEALLGEGEFDERRRHPLISHVTVPAQDPDWAARALAASVEDDLIMDLEYICADEASVWASAN